MACRFLSNGIIAKVCELLAFITDNRKVYWKMYYCYVCTYKVDLWLVMINFSLKQCCSMLHSVWLIFRLFRLPINEPIKLKRHKVIAQAYNRKQEIKSKGGHRGRISFSFHSTHDDPLGRYCVIYIFVTNLYGQYSMMMM